MDKIEEAINYIQSIEGLADADKQEFINRIKNGEPVDEVFDAIEDKIQGKIDDVFDKAGVKLDPDDPEYQAKEKEMMDEAEAAKKEFNATMSDIDAEASQIQADTTKELDEVAMEDARAKLAAE